jgi:glycosyltransferase involved in cell wall biosynthesis
MPGLKILYYNWVDFDDELGGGVSVYQKNLIDAAARHGDDAWFLSSGSSYSPFRRRPFIRAVRSWVRPLRFSATPDALEDSGIKALRRSGGAGAAHRFELVNSPILAPGQAAFAQSVATEPAMEALFEEFLAEHGPFDVVHFNNLEGIPISFLRLARQHAPGAKVIYSVHNYFAFCPQVNLWFQEKEACVDFRDGRKCANCLVNPPEPAGTRRRYQVDYFLRRLGIRPKSLPGRIARWISFVPLRLLYRGAKVALLALLGKLPPPPPGQTPPPGAHSSLPPPTGKPLVLLDLAAAARFSARRRQFVAAINEHADHVLAVSRRVEELTVQHGINPAKVRTLYIGTRFARPRQERCTRDCTSSARAAHEQGPAAESGKAERARRGVLRLVYLGYMRRDKGFFFYLRALSKMPDRLASRLQLVFATRLWDARVYAKIRRLAHRFDGVTLFDGYTHAHLPGILADVDLGVVPVLWEDNLPQVAIECVASGVPVLTSDRGGARELLDCPALVFKAGSIPDFHARLSRLLDEPEQLGAAVAQCRILRTPEEHYEQLRAEVYLGSAAATEEPARDRPVNVQEMEV